MNEMLRCHSRCQIKGSFAGQRRRGAVIVAPGIPDGGLDGGRRVLPLRQYDGVALLLRRHSDGRTGGGREADVCWQQQ